MENMDCFVETIHMEYRNLKYFHYYWGYIRVLGVDLYLIERLDVSWGIGGSIPNDEGENIGYGSW
jgi:hypothetical protein